MSDTFRQDFDATFDAAETTVRRAQAGKWNGKGKAPSREAAIEWALSRGVPRDEVEELIEEGSRDDMAAAARRAVERRGGNARKAAREAAAERGGAPDTVGGSELVDTDGDGRITEADVAAAVGGDDAFADIFGEGPQVEEDNPRGAPLWPFEGDPELLAEITVENKSKGPAESSHWGSRLGRDVRNGSFGRPDRVAARYHEKDTLSPLRWSAEQRADLQRVMQGLGLYGDSKVRLGGWTARDQAIFAEVLAYSNTEGLRWHETIAGWRKGGLPPELEESISGDGSGARTRPTIQVMNPIDIRRTARDVSQSLTGEVDRSFVEGAVAPYQAHDAGAQASVYADQEAGGGGQMNQAASADAFLEEKLRREQPLKVDGYQFLNQFQGFMQMLGVQ